MFLIDAEQLFCLIKDGFIVYPELAVEDIQDKSKSEGMAMWVILFSLICDFLDSEKFWGHLTLPLTFQIPAHV